MTCIFYPPSQICGESRFSLLFLSLDKPRAILVPKPDPPLNLLLPPHLDTEDNPGELPTEQGSLDWGGSHREGNPSSRGSHGEGTNVEGIVVGLVASMVLYLAVPVLCLATAGTRQLSPQVNQVNAATATVRVVGRRLARQVVVILDIILTEGRMVRRRVGWRAGR